MRITAFLFLILMSGCSLFDSNIKTTITWDNGDKIEVSSKEDALVVIEKGDEKLTVDNRGEPSLFKLFIESFFIRASGVGGNSKKESLP